MNLYEQMEQVANRLSSAAPGTIAHRLSQVLFDSLNDKGAPEAHDAPGPNPKRDWSDHVEGVPETSPHCSDWNAKCLQDLKGELIKSNDEANSLREDLASHRALVKRMSGERQKLEGEKMAAEQSAERLHKTNRSLGEYVNKAEAERDKLIAEIVTLKDLLTQHAKERAELLERKAAVESRLETRTKQRDEAREMYRERGDTIRDLQTRLETRTNERNQYMHERDKYVSMYLETRDAAARDQQHTARVEKAIKDFEQQGLTPTGRRPVGPEEQQMPRASVDFEAQPAETPTEMLKRIGLDAKLWADEFAKSVVRANGWSDRVTGPKIAEAALGWFANAFHAAQTYSPRNKSGDVIWQSPPTDDQIANWANSGFFDHYSDAARMAMEHCQIPIYRYVALQKIFETFGDVQRGTVHLHYGEQSEAKADTELNGYGQGIVDSAQRLKNVLDREGLLPKDGHPEDAQ